MNQSHTVSQYHFHPELMLRTPVYPFNAYKGADWKDCLQDPLFRLALQIASQSLYEEFDRNGKDGCRKYNQSLWRYLNRMKFRPTPFGLFAGFSVTRWGEQTKIVLEDSGILHIQPDFATVIKEIMELISERSAVLLHYKPNPSLYAVMGTYRYLRYHQDAASGKRTYEVSTIEKDEYIAGLLKYCTEPMTVDQLTVWLKLQYDFPVEDCALYIASLINAQVFIPEPEVNICGSDFLQRVHKASPKQCCGVSFAKQEQLNTGLATDRKYINLERPVVQGFLSSWYRQQIVDGMHCLERILPDLQPVGLERFKADFIKKYDRQYIPLMQALDPEIGIGYNRLGNADQIPALLKDIDLYSTEQNTDAVQWTPVHTLLLEKWNAVGRNGILRLEEEDISKLVVPRISLPNSCPVVFRITEQGLFIEQAGGATATALLGRFTPLSPAIHNIAKQIVQQEEAANPGMAFAEISYISDPHTANIDRRAHLYSYEIPILCGSLLPGKQQIQLNELWIGIKNNEIMLWSKKAGCRVIPRFSSAFNYLRSDLPVFRFLCDLQHQSLRGNFSFDMEHFFPGLSFYPRVCYKSTILHLAKWVIAGEMLLPIYASPPPAQAGALYSFLVHLNMPRHITADEYDNQLVFDLQEKADLENLLAVLKTKATTVIKEHIAPPEQNLVTDTVGAGFMHQFITVLQHDGNIYKAVPFPVSDTAHEQQRIMIPGSGWLYNQLYIHPMRSNELLRKHILPCLHRMKLQGLVKKWFFIRYADPGYHLRIRLHINPKQAGYAISRFEKTMNVLVQSGVIQSYHICSYERELERYTPELIEDCEDWFCAGTSLISEWILFMQDDAAYDYYAIVLPCIDEMLKAFNYDYETAIALFEGLFRAMYDKSPIDKKQVQDKSRKLNRDVFAERKCFNTLPLKKAFKLFSIQTNALALKANIAMNAERKQVFFMDLLHMHLNRLLVTDSFHQEMILYYALCKHYQSRQYFAARAS